MARAGEIPGLDCEEPLRLAAARAIRVRADEVFEHSPGVLDLRDVERVHDMRVATRRLRAALEIFEACLPPKRRRRALEQVKALADALGERRDRDVEIEFLEGFAAEAPEEDRDALASLIEELHGERRQANQALASFVAPKRLKKLRRRLMKLVAGAER